MLNVRLYFNTGFDGVNIPFSPAILDNPSDWIVYKDVPAVDLVQRKGLAKLTIKCKLGSSYAGSDTPPVGDTPFAQNNYSDTLESVDYVRISGTPESAASINKVIGNVYYSVLNVEMQSSDVAVLILLEDYITTAGGISRLRFNDGIITRLSGEDCSFGNKPWIDDEYLACQYPMWTRCVLVGDYQDEGEAKEYTFVESTIDLTKQPSIKTVGNEEAFVNVPTMDPVLLHKTNYFFPVTYTSTTSKVKELPNPTGAALFQVAPGNQIELGMQNARALGLESALLSQYVVPSDMVVYQWSGQTLNIYGRKKRFNVGLPAPFRDNTYNIAMNKLLKVGLIGASGDHLDFDIRDVYREDNNGIISNSIVRAVDPRPEGRPYYRFSFIKSAYFGLGMNIYDSLSGNTADAEMSNVPFSIYAVKGAKWRKVPFHFTEVSGMEILEQKYKNTRAVTERQFAGQNAILGQALATARLSEAINVPKMAAGAAEGVIGGATGGFSNYERMLGSKNLSGGQITAGLLGMGANVAGGLVSSAADAANSYLMHAAATNMADIAQSTAYGVYAAERNKELYDFGVSMYTVAPELQGTGDMDFIRDITDNCCVYYYTVIDDKDRVRLNKILKMFGEKTYLPLDAKDNAQSESLQGAEYFNRGKYFNYIRITGANIAANDAPINRSDWQEYGYSQVRPDAPAPISKAEREGAKAQFEAGVRMWKIPPRSYEYGYIDNTNYK